MKLTIVYDNRACKGLEEGWGFACYVETDENRIMFDTGDDGNKLLNNMKRLGIDSKRIDTVFLSHDHADHTGGLPVLLDNMNPDKLNTIVYVLPSFSSTIKDTVKRKGFLYSEVIGFSPIRDDVYSTGPLKPPNGWIEEQAMVVRSDKGLVVITGCAHPGIYNILSYVKNWFPKEPMYMVVGGFHMLSMDDTLVQDTVDRLHNLGVKHVVPCHCTGDHAVATFANTFGAGFTNCCAGMEIEI